MSAGAVTVLGRVPVDDLGITLIHEHLLMSLLVYWRGPAAEDSEAQARSFQPVALDNLWWVRANIMDNRDNCSIDDLETAVGEVAHYGRAGGRTLVEVTSRGIGRNPAGLVEIARRTGVHIVMGCGFYIAASHPADILRRDVGAIADEICRDLQEGVEGSGIRAGVIGEIGTSNPITEVEERVVQAAVLAQQKTGAPIVIHPAPGQHTVPCLADLLERTGADPSRVVLSHLDERMRDNLDALIGLARRGFVLGYDTFGREAYYASRNTQMPSDADRIRNLVKLVEAGHAGSVALAQDICFKSELTRFGGHGYAHILYSVLPRLRLAGVAQAQLDQMLIETPRRLLGWD